MIYDELTAILREARTLWYEYAPVREQSNPDRWDKVCRYFRLGANMSAPDWLDRTIASFTIGEDTDVFGNAIMPRLADFQLVLDDIVWTLLYWKDDTCYKQIQPIGHQLALAANLIIDYLHSQNYATRTRKPSYIWQ